MKRGSGVSQQPLETPGIPAQAERALVTSHPGHPRGFKHGTEGVVGR